MHRSLIPLSLGLALAGAPWAMPVAGAAPSLAGTLTCTAEPAPSDAKKLGGWKLSCAFEQTSSKTVQHYGGEITGLDQGTRTAGGKALLVWTVLTVKNTAGDPTNLVGVYKTATEQALPPQSLIGGRDQTIVLQPADAEQNIAPSVQLLQLELPKA
jgi:hypothetical protein